MTTKNESRWRFKPLFAWQEQIEAAWLAEQERAGWRLTDVLPLFYRFERGEPRDMVYRFDFSPGRGGDEKEYVALCEDAGWEHVCTTSGWLYFRASPEVAAHAEFFSDVSSQIEKFKRVLTFLLIAGFPALFFSFLLISDQLNDSWFATSPVRFLIIMIAGGVAFAALKITFRIRRLRKRMAEAG